MLELPQGSKVIDYKWIYKTERDISGNIKRYKAKLVIKSYTKKKDIDYHETFSPISKNDNNDIGSFFWFKAP
jgi:hypothetical protein